VCVCHKLKSTTNWPWDLVLWDFDLTKSNVRILLLAQDHEGEGFALVEATCEET